MRADDLLFQALQIIEKELDVMLDSFAVKDKEGRPVLSSITDGTALRDIRKMARWVKLARARLRMPARER